MSKAAVTREEKWQKILSAAKGQLDFLKEEGIVEIESSLFATAAAPAVSQKEKVAPVQEMRFKKITPAPTHVHPVVAPPVAAVTNKKEALLELRKKVLPCIKCAALVSGRTNVVFGAGNANAKLCFVGEAPGRDEDLQGFPFVGRAGQLLTQIIEAIGYSRKEVFIANVLKCRPPQNRNPLPEEIHNCEPYLLAQLDIIQPKVICALGTFAAQTLLKTDAPISMLRGKFHDYHGIKLIPTFHPAFLLRNPGAKKTVWEDMKKIRKELESLS